MTEHTPGRVNDEFTPTQKRLQNIIGNRIHDHLGGDAVGSLGLSLDRSHFIAACVVSSIIVEMSDFFSLPSAAAYNHLTTEQAIRAMKNYRASRTGNVHADVYNQHRESAIILHNARITYDLTTEQAVKAMSAYNQMVSYMRSAVAWFRDYDQDYHNQKSRLALMAAEDMLGRVLARAGSDNAEGPEEIRIIKECGTCKHFERFGATSNLGKCYGIKEQPYRTIRRDDCCGLWEPSNAAIARAGKEG